MDTITAGEIKKIAGLARLELSDDGVTGAVSDLSGILSHFSTIQNIDTTNISAAEDVSGLRNVVRKDTVQSELLGSTESVIKNVPHAKDGYVQVGGVFSEGEVS